MIQVSLENFEIFMWKGIKLCSQGGDPSNTGKGGESIYGGTTKDEFHGDLRHGRNHHFLFW